MIAISAALVACSKPAQPAAQAAAATPVTSAAPAPGAPGQNALPAGHPAISTTATTAAAVAASPAPAGTLTGTVAETMDSGGYTYVKVRTAGGTEEWAAVQQTKVKKGQQVTISAQMTAEKFQSNTLKRTFDRIIFGTIEGPAPAAAAASTPQMPAGHPAMTSASAMGTAAQHMSGGADVGAISVEKAPGGRTVAEVWAGTSELANKEVVVRGKVVKFLRGIMGTNFMHLRDGSGSDAKGDFDLTITTDDNATVGEVVTIRGVLHVDKDFGAGYHYPIIVEKARITR